MNCHLPQMRKGTIKLISPAYMGKKYTFSFTCADTTGGGGTLPVAGVNIHASCGTLAAVEPGTKIVNGQLIHSQPLPTTSNARTWQFSWTAPAASTSCGFTIAGLLGDNNKKATGDVTCLAMKALLVLPSPDAGPPDLLLNKDSGQKSDTGATTKDGTPGLDVAPSDADRGSRDIHPATDSPTEDDGCGCRVSAGPAALIAPLQRSLFLLSGVLLALMRGRRRR